MVTLAEKREQSLTLIRIIVKKRYWLVYILRKTLFPKAALYPPTHDVKDFSGIDIKEFTSIQNAESVFYPLPNTHTSKETKEREKAMLISRKADVLCWDSRATPSIILRKAKILHTTLSLGSQYEIDKDKDRKFYVRARVDLTEVLARFDPVEEVDVSGKRKWYEAKEEVEMDERQHDQLLKLFDALGREVVREVEPVNRLEAAIEDMLMGKTQEVRSYLETSSEKDIFLHGVRASQRRLPDIDEWDADQDLLRSGKAEHLEPPEKKIVEIPTSGETALHLAAREKYPEMVKLLLEHGADPNARRVDGRTPLMEAALWGRLDNVRLLLDHGADKSIQCVRRGVRRRAVDLAENTLLENRKERRERSRGGHHVHNETAYERDDERDEIVLQLSDEDTDDDHHGQASVLSTQGFVRTEVMDDGRATLSTMIASFDVPSEYKTIGILIRGKFNGPSAFQTVTAMSGWTHEPRSDLNVLPGRRWTDEVFSLCRIIGHVLLKDRYDHDMPGQFNACHAEKQLIAYFVSRHMILPHEVDEEDFGLSRLSLDDQSPRKKILKLKSIEPPQRLKEAVIWVSREMCNDCRAFVERVNEALGLNIVVRRAIPCI